MAEPLSVIPGNRRPRLLRAAVLFVALGLGMSLVLGFVAAVGNGNAPARMTVPLPHVGDRGEYTLTIVEGGGSDVKVVQPEKRLTSFEWLAPRDLRDATGTPHRVNDLHFVEFSCEETGDQACADVVYSFDAASNEMIASGHVQGNAGDARDYRKTWFHNERDNFVVLCGLQNKLQGRTVDITGTTDLFRPCDYENYWSPHGMFRAKGTEELGGHETVFFTSARPAGPAIHVWMTEDLPYPIRLTVEDQRDPGRYLVLRLSAFQRGTTPIDAPDARPAPAEPFPDLRLDDLGAEGPDTSGLEVGFTLPQALAEARSHPDAAALRRFLDQTPDAYVGAASLSHSRDHRTSEPRETHTWQIWLTNGPSTMAFIVYQDIGPVAKPLPVVGPDPVGLPPEVTGTEVKATYRFQPIDGSPSGRQFPPAGTKIQLPALSDLADRWQANARQEYVGKPANTFSFWVACGADCPRVVRFASVGFHEDTTRDDGRDLLESTYEVNDWYNEGFEAAITDSTQRFGAPTGLAQTPAQDDRIVAAGVSVDLWSFPPGIYVAGAGLLALLTSMLYAAWPSAKAATGFGMVGLFSRLQGPALLEHPVRKEVFQAVEANPGIHLKELVRLVGRPRNTVEHHARKLAGAGLVTVHTQNGYACLFAKGRVDRFSQGAAPFLKAPGARRLLEEVVRQPGRSARQVARAIGLAPSVVSFHLKRLGEAGLVRTERQGAGLRLMPTELGVRQAAAQPSPVSAAA